jgi:hypothetical protein
MQDIYDVIENVNSIYDSNSSFEVLKDFERVIDELDIYVYKNWKDGELVSGPKITRHWVSCSFMWPVEKMPDPVGGKRLLDYDCKVRFGKDYIIKPRKIRDPNDIRPGTKKGKLDKQSIWLVQIDMPKKLIQTIYSGYDELMNYEEEAATDGQSQELAPGAVDAAAAGGAPPAPMAPPVEPPVEGGPI